MFSLLSDPTMRARLWTELPAFLAALGIAEFFYKFHSFFLETGAFLLTWWVLGLLLEPLRRRVTAPPGP